jgi:hypothetical protein
MSDDKEQRSLSDSDFATLRRRARVILLLNAAERAGVTPLSTSRLHAFAYLADVLSPVWDLPTFDAAVLKIIGGPFYRDLQTEIDRLVVMGMLQISKITYVQRPRNGARLDACYALQFSSPHLEPILTVLGANDPSKSFDPADVRLNSFLVELAGALARLPDDEIDSAATADVTYDDPRIGTDNLIELDQTVSTTYANLSVATAERFGNFLPEGVGLTSGEKLYLYASYLGRRMHGGGRFRAASRRR